MKSGHVPGHTTLHFQLVHLVLEHPDNPERLFRVGSLDSTMLLVDPVCE